jgi:uncharacterized alkaline shock family protein YloU
MTYAVRTDDGTITLTDAALASIVVQAAESVGGARVRRQRRKLGVELEGMRARVEIELAVAYGNVLPDVAQDVQVRVTDALTQMCGLEVSAVDVTIEELDG